MKRFQVVEIMNPVRNEMRFEVMYKYIQRPDEDDLDTECYYSVCFCRFQQDAANVCSAMNKMEQQTMSVYEETKNCKMCGNDTWIVEDTELCESCYAMSGITKGGKK